jgi:dihydrodipicolinate synthase/N-acetylneuraminate lyase
MVVEAMAHAIIREAAEQDPLYLSRPYYHGPTSRFVREHHRNVARSTGLPPALPRVVRALYARPAHAPVNPAPVTMMCCAAPAS